MYNGCFINASISVAIKKIYIYAIYLLQKGGNGVVKSLEVNNYRVGAVIKKK